MTSTRTAKPRAIALENFKTLIVCRGPIALEAMEVASGIGLSLPDIIVSKREVYESAEAHAPWAEFRDLYERLHILDDYRDQDAILSIARKFQIDGIYVGSRAMLADLIAHLDQTGIRPVIDSVFDFEEAPAAFRRLESGAHFGKIVVGV